MIAQVDPSLVPLLASPASGVAALLLVGGAAYRLIVAYGIPLVSKLGERHLAQIDALVAQSAAQASAVTASLSAIERTLVGVDRRLARLESVTDAGQFLTPNPGALSPDRGA